MTGLIDELAKAKRTDFTWRACRSGNPNKAWVIDSDGRKLSALMSHKAADDLCVAHNMIVGYLEACNQILQRKVNHYEGKRQ